MQHNIQMLTEVFNGGYCWEIVTELCVNCLCWTTMDEEDEACAFHPNMSQTKNETFIFGGVLN